MNRNIHLLFFAIIMAFSGSLNAKTWVVSPGGNIPTIGMALEKAAAYDTILVKSGQYAEGSLSITRPICLLGEGMPVIDGQHKYQPISVHSSNVSVSGFKIIACGNNSLEDWSAIKVYNAKWVYIWNNVFDDNYFAVYLSACRHCFISGNQMTAYGNFEQNSGNGVHAWKCDSLKVVNNHIKGHRDGIYFEFVGHSFVAGNFIKNNLRYGLHFMFSHNDHYQNNQFIDNGAGVAVMYSKFVHMDHNQFIFNRGAAAYGLLLKEIYDSVIENNQFTDNTSGIFMEGCVRGKIQQNNFLKNGWAIRIQASCEDNVLTDNNFKANTFDIATNSSRLNNQLSANYWDKYEGYDLNKDGTGDVPYRPVSLYSMLADDMPYAMMLWRSFCVYLLDRAEKVIPSISPDKLRDEAPRMKPYDPDTTPQ